MKKILIFPILFLCSISFAQRVAIEPVLQEGSCLKIYQTYFNKMKILVENVPCDSLIIKSTNLEIDKDSNCIYYLRILDKNDNSELEIYAGSKLIKEYRIIADESIPLPTIDINSKKKSEFGTILSDQIDSVFCRPIMIDKFNNAITFSVVYFKATLVREKKDLYVETIRGNHFSSKMKQQLSHLKFGDKLILDNIVIMDTFKNLYKVPSKVFPAL